jgi:general secretion pathway protein J
MKCRMTDPRGFTLLEILVAMAVFTTILITLFTVFNTFLTSAQQVEQDIDLQERHQPGLMVMTADLEQVFILQPPRYRPPQFNDEPDPYRFEAKEINVDGRIFSHLGFATVNHLVSGENPVYGAARIEYYVYRHGDRFDLHRSDRRFPLDRDPDPCRDPVLVRNIQVFSLMFTNENGEDDREWDSDSKDFGYSLPLRVTITVETAHDEGKEIIGTSVSLPVSRQVGQ